MTEAERKADKVLRRRSALGVFFHEAELLAQLGKIERVFGVEHFFHVELGLVLLFLAEIDEKGMGERLKIGNVLFVGILGIEAVAQKATFLRKQSELFAVVFRLFVPLLFDAFPFRNGAPERFGDLPALPLENGEAGTGAAGGPPGLFRNFTLAPLKAALLPL